MLMELVAARVGGRCAPAGRSWQRSFAKTITWRLFATVDTFVISALVTGNLRWAGSIVSVEIVSKMTLYYLHERAWGRARWGIEAGTVEGRTSGPMPRRAGAAAPRLAA